VMHDVAHMVISRLLLLNAAHYRRVTSLMGADYGTLKPEIRQRRGCF